jgi:hypothetical protein
MLCDVELGKENLALRYFQQLRKPTVKGGTFNFKHIHHMPVASCFLSTIALALMYGAGACDRVRLRTSEIVRCEAEIAKPPPADLGTIEQLGCKEDAVCIPILRQDLTVLTIVVLSEGNQSREERPYTAQGRPRPPD